MLKRSDKTKRAHGWDLAGGGLDEGEDPREGIAREIKEEAGLDVKNIFSIAVIFGIEAVGI